MEFFRIKKDIPFMKHALVFNAISFITFALAVFFLLTRGLHLSVEFTGGTVMEVSYSQTADLAQVRSTVGSLCCAEVLPCCTGRRISTSREVPKFCTWASPKPSAPTVLRTSAWSAVWL